METDTCLYCKEKFSNKNVFTDEGWAETKISNVCEKCFDECTLSLEKEPPQSEE